MNKDRALRDLGRMVANSSMHSELLGLIEAGHVPLDGYGIETPRWTLLMASLKLKKFALAEQLLRLGADPLRGYLGAKFEDDRSPFREAVIVSALDVVRLMLDLHPTLVDHEEFGRRPIQDAVNRMPPNPELVQLLVDRGADLNFKIDKKYTFERYMKELWKPQPSRMDAYEPILKILGYR